jgi:hypothetical protein
VGNGSDQGGGWRRVGALAATAVFTLAAVVAVALVLRSSEREESATVLAAIVALISLLLVVTPLVWRWSGVRQASPELAQLAPVLAERVARRWHEEAERRKLTVPAPIMVSWQLVAPDVEAAAAWARRPLALRPPVLPQHGSAPREQLSAGVVQELHSLYRAPAVDRIVLVGEPGAGKTGALILLLLEALRVRAALDPGQAASVPVPVLLSLGEWDPSEQRLKDWAASVIARDYPGLDVATSLELLATGQIALFLDGFEEMPKPLWRDARDAIDAATQLRVVLACRPVAEQRAALTYSYRIRLDPVGVEAACAYLLEHASASESAAGWRELVAHVHTAPDGPVARALSTPLMIRLAIDAYERTGDPRDLLDERRFPREEEIQRFLIGRIIPNAYEGQTASRGISAAAAERHLTTLAAQMDGARDLAWWRMRQALPWMPPVVIALVFLGAVGGVAAVLGSVRVGLALGLPAVLVAVPAAGLTPMLAIRRGYGEVKGTAPRLGTALAIGILFGVCLATLHALQDGQLGAGLLTVLLGASFGLAGGSTLGVLVLHDGPLVAELRLPSGRDAVFGLPVGLATGSVYGLIAGSWLALGVSAIATLGFMLGVAWTHPPERPQDGATAASSFRADLRGGALIGLAIGVTLTLTLTLVLAEQRGVLSSLAIAAAIGSVFASLTGIAASQAAALTLIGSWRWLRRQGPPLLLGVTRRHPGFLEDARAREVLRCVGTLYQFRHARLQDQLRGIDD